MGYKIDLVRIIDGEKESFKNGRFNDYWQELSKYERESLEYGFFDRFFGNTERNASWFIANGNKIGFVFTGKSVEKGLFIVQFYIFKEYQHKGFGLLCAECLLRNNPGLVIVRYLDKNLPAKNFWHKVINQFSKKINGVCQYKETPFDEETTELTFSTHLSSN